MIHIFIFEQRVSDLQLNSEGLELFLCFKENFTVMIFKQTDYESL